MTSRAHLLALRPPRPPPASLAPQPLGIKGGRPYERRLQVYLERAWPAFAAALEAVGLGDREEEIGAALFASGSADRPADDNRRDAERHWTEVEHKLVSIMTERGLDLDLACASIGLDITRLQERVRWDPLLEARLEVAWLRGTAKLHGVVWDSAMRGKERSALALLQARDPRYQPTVKVEITESQILSSQAFQGVVKKIVDVLPPGHTCEQCGGCECRARVERELSDG